MRRVGTVSKVVVEEEDLGVAVEGSLVQGGFGAVTSELDASATAVVHVLIPVPLPLDKLVVVILKLGALSFSEW